MKNEIPIAGVAHQAGTCRFGTDPASSVLDIDCRAHELDNLYVVDTSVFPSIGAVKSGADHDGELAARRRPPPGADAVTDRINTRDEETEWHRLEMR